MSCIEKTFIINGYEVFASYEKAEIDTLFLPLIAQLRQLQKEKQRRILVFLAAPPGVGKTTLSMFLEYLSYDKLKKPVQSIGMDGFHHYQAYLNTHTMLRDGKEVLMTSLKGCPETFDIEKLRAKIIQLTKEEVVKWPLYVRSHHDPVEDKIDVTSEIVLLEGNYLLLEDEQWSDLKQYCDVAIFISTKVEYCKERLLARKMLSGVSKEEATIFYNTSDAYNAKYVLTHSQKADITYEMKEDKTYHIKIG